MCHIPIEDGRGREGSSQTTCCLVAAIHCNNVCTLRNTTELTIAIPVAMCCEAFLQVFEFPKPQLTHTHKLNSYAVVVQQAEGLSQHHKNQHQHNNNNAPSKEAIQGTLKTTGVVKVQADEFPEETTEDLPTLTHRRPPHIGSQKTSPHWLTEDLPTLTHRRPPYIDSQKTSPH